MEENTAFVGRPESSANFKYISLVNRIFLCVEMESIGSFTVFKFHCRVKKNWKLMQALLNFVVLLAKRSCEHGRQLAFCKRV